MTELGTTNISALQGSTTARLDQLRDVAGEVVGSVFYGQLLQTMRDSTLKGEYGHGGRGEEIFQAQLDQVLAEGAGRARGFTLAEAIYERFAGRVSLLAGKSTEQEAQA